MQAAQGCQMHTYAAPSQHHMVNNGVCSIAMTFQGSFSRLALNALRAGIVADIILICVLAGSVSRHTYC